MPKVSPFLSSANAGEFSPRMDARIDFDRYPAAVSRALNLIALPQGGLTLRPGTRFVKSVKTAGSRPDLYSFEPVSGLSYVLEIGSAYVRFYRAQSQLTVATTATVITNGTFAANITNWTDRSTGTANIAHTATGGGRMRLTGDASGWAWAEQAISVSATDDTTEHVIRFKLDGTYGETATVYVGTTSRGTNLWNKSGYGLGWHTVAFTPGDGVTTIYFQVIYKGTLTGSAAMHLDDVEFLSNVPLELTGPYTAAQSRALKVAQSNDVLYLFHSDVKPYRLARRGDRAWSLEEAFFEDGPWLPINPETDLEEAQLIKNPAFNGGMQDWTDSNGQNDFVEYDGAQGVIFFREDDGGNDTADVRQSVTTGNPTGLHIIHFQIVGGGDVAFMVGTASGAADIVASANYKAGWYTVSFTPGVSPFHIRFKRGANQGHATIVPGMGGAFCYHDGTPLLAASATTGSVTVTAQNDFAPFVSTDVGRLIRLEHAGREPGWGIITAFTDAQNVTVRVKRKFASTIATETWQLGAWSDTTGWPHSGTFYQQRLVCANTEDNPKTIWASQAGDFPNFRPDSFVDGATTTEDDDALDFTLDTEQVSPIYWMVGVKKLIVGTASGNLAITSRGPALTPSDFNVEPQNPEAAGDFTPVRAFSAVIFLDDTQHSVFDEAYNYETDLIEAADLNELAEHISGTTGFEQIVYQRKPYSIVWARKEDGTVGALTYNRRQRVVGWTPIKIAGSAAGDAVVESLAVIKGAAVSGSQTYSSLKRHELWLQVKRTINGSTTRYIEVMEGFFAGSNRAEYETESAWRTAMLTAQKEGFYVDSGITYSGASTAVIPGLTHLVGEQVIVLGDGIPIVGLKTVSGAGEITLSANVTHAQIGLSYEWRYRSLKLPYGAQAGSAVGMQKRVSQLKFVLLDSGSFSYGVDVHERTDFTWYPASDHIHSSSALFTGETKYETESDLGPDPRLWLKGSSPSPFTLLGVAIDVDPKSL